MRCVVEIVDAGPFTSVQDLGRPGLAYLGVGRSGAADRPSLRLANRLVGNPEDSAALEVTMGGLVARFSEITLVALTGAPCTARVADRPLPLNAPQYVPAGAQLRLDRPDTGLRTYVAVRGGVDVEPVLGSRATDTLSGLGPDPVRAGTCLPVGPSPGTDVPVDLAPRAPWPAEPVLGVLPGPRDDWFSPEALRLLRESRFEVSERSDRVGLRLRGPELAREVGSELPSEGMVTGALQVPPDGDPILLLPDHPVTGGYPVIAVVGAADVPLAAQARPGTSLRFAAQR